MEQFVFGSLSDGRVVTAYRIENQAGMQLVALDYGCTIQSLIVPDRKGNPVDVVLGYDTALEYEKNGGFFGAAIGRFGNRIGGARFVLNGKTYDLEANEGRNQLHGGFYGFDKQFWDVAELPSGLRFTRVSPNGEGGYPGNVKCMITYILGADNTLTITYDADPDADTPVNMTNHSYFNLAGSGDILDHDLMIDAANFTPVDAESIPTGEIAPVAGTPLDFTAWKKVGLEIGADWEQLHLVKGYDHNFVLDSHAELHRAARVYCEQTGIALEIQTTTPAVQFYSGNCIDATSGKGGAPLGVRYGLCLETQIHPDAVNKPNFPDPIVCAGEHYMSQTLYRFTACEGRPE